VNPWIYDHSHQIGGQISKGARQLRSELKRWWSKRKRRSREVARARKVIVRCGPSLKGGLELQASRRFECILDQLMACSWTWTLECAGGLICPQLGTVLRRAVVIEIESTLSDPSTLSYF